MCSSSPIVQMIKTEAISSEPITSMASKIIAPSKLMGAEVSVIAHSQAGGSQASDLSKITEVQKKISELETSVSERQQQSSRRSIPVTLAIWVFKPFLLCGIGLKVVVYAICRAIKKVLNFVFGSKYSAEFHAWCEIQRKSKRTLSEAAFDTMTNSRKRKLNIHMPLLSTKPTLESYLKKPIEIEIVDGLKVSSFCLEEQEGEKELLSPRFTHVSNDMPLPLKNIGQSCYLNSFIQLLRNSSEFIQEIRIPLKKSNDLSQECFELLETYQNAWVRILDVIEYICLNKNEKNRKVLEDVLEGELWALRNWIFTGQNKKYNNETASKLEKHPFHSELVSPRQANSITAEHDPAYLFEGFFDLLNFRIPSKTERRIRYDDTVYCKGNEDEQLSRLIQCAVPLSGLSLQKLVENQFFEPVNDPKNAVQLELEDGSVVYVPTYINDTSLKGEPPKTLAVQLKRFSQEIGRSDRKNLNDVVLEDEVVDLKRIFHEKKEVKYKITGCITHHSKSTIHTGHYTSYVKRGESWYYTNDSAAVRSLTWEQMKKEVGRSAYIFTLEHLEGVKAASGA